MHPKSSDKLTMEQSFQLFHRKPPTVTSSPREVRLWIEGLNHSFQEYGEKFERARINGERLFNITEKNLHAIGIVQTDDKNIILEAVASLCEKNKIEEHTTQEEGQNNKKMSTRFRKQSEDLEHAIDRVLVMISERRRARSLHGINEQPAHSINTATLELINMVKMILNILERLPFDCMSEFSRLKNHLIKHNKLLKHFTEQSDLSNEMESEMIDVCKSITKICQYIIALPPNIPRPETELRDFAATEERPPRVQVPVTVKPEVMSFPVQPEPDNSPPTQHSSVVIATTSSSRELTFAFQDMYLQNERASERSEFLSLERLSTPSNKRKLELQHDDENKSETEVSHTKGSKISASSFEFKSLQDLTIIESDTPPMDSGSEKCFIDSDSDRAIDSDSGLEQYSKELNSIIWGMSEGIRKCLSVSDSVKQLPEGEKPQTASGSDEQVVELKQYLVRVEQCQGGSDSLKYWGDSDSEKGLEDSDSDRYLMNSDNERPETESNSEKNPMALAFVKHSTKAERRRMASDSIKRMIESESKLVETVNIWKIPDSERYVIDTERMVSASDSGIQCTTEEKDQETVSNRYMMGSDSVPHRTGSENFGLTSTAVECLLDTKTYELSTESEGLWIDSGSEGSSMELETRSQKIASDIVKDIIKEEDFQKISGFDEFSRDLRYESERYWMDCETEPLLVDSGSLGTLQHKSARPEDSAGRCQDDIQKHLDSFEGHPADSHSKKHQADSEIKGPQKSESEQHLMAVQKEPWHLQFQRTRLETIQEEESPSTESDSEKECTAAILSERDHLDSENEAHRLGARKKDNRPEGFWRPMSIPLSYRPRKEAEDCSVQRTDSKVSRSQLVSYLSGEKITRAKETSPTVSDKQKEQNPQQSHIPYPDPLTLKNTTHHGNASCKISVFKSNCKDDRYTHIFQSSASSLNTIPLLSTEAYTSDIAMPDCHSVSISPRSVLQSTTERNNMQSLGMSTQICLRCYMEISDSYHKCLMDSDDDDNSDRHLHCNSPVSPPPDPELPVDFFCSLQEGDYMYSLDLTSHFHSESVSATQNLMSSAIIQLSHMNRPDTMHCRNIPDLDSIINTGSMIGLENEGKSNLAGKSPNESILDDSKLVSDENLKDKDNTKRKSASKSQTEHDDDTDSENKTEEEEETDPENEDNDENKKDPKDKSDPDNSDPKDRDGGNDTNGGSDSRDDAGPTHESDSSSDGDPNNGTDPNNEPDSNIDNTGNNNGNSKYSTDAEEDRNTNSDLDCGLNNVIDHDGTANYSDGTNPKYSSGPQNGTDKDCSLYLNSNAGPSTLTTSEFFCIIGSWSQNFRFTLNSLDPSNAGVGSSNSPGPPKDLDSNYNAWFHNAANSSVVNHSINPDFNYIINPDFKDGTRPTNAVGHKRAVVLDSNSDVDYVPESTQAVGSSYVFNQIYISRNNLSFTAVNADATNTSNTTSYSGAFIHSDAAIYAIDTNHIHKFTHFIFFIFVINNYNDINTHNAYTFTDTTSLEINCGSSISIFFEANSHTFCTTTNYASTSNTFTIFQFPDTSNYTIFVDHKFCAQPRHSIGSMDSASFKHTAGSKVVLDAKESGIFTGISEIQNSTGIKDLTILKIHAILNFQLPSFDFIVEAESADVVKFAMPSGAVNLFKLLENNRGGLRTDRESLARPMEEKNGRISEGRVWRSADPPTRRPEGGLPVRPIRGRAVSPERRQADRHARGRPISPLRRIAVSPSTGRAVRPAGGQAERQSRGRKRENAVTKNHSQGHNVNPAGKPASTPATGRAQMSARASTVSPIRARAVSPPRGRQARNQTVSPARRHAGFVVGLARRPPLQEVILGAAVGLTVKSAEGYDEEVSKSSKQSKKSAAAGKDENQNESSILKDTKADGFIHLPEFRIDLAPNSRRNHTFQATHAKIKNFYFAAEYSDEMNYWVGQMLQLAYGSSFGDSADNAEYQHIGAMIYAKCVLALKREFPIIWCNNCYEAATIVSINPNFPFRRAQNMSDEFIYFRPIDADIREEARRQKQQKSAKASSQQAREGILPRDLGIIREVVMVTTTPLTKELECIALVRPKTSGLLRLEKIPIKSPGVLESLRLDVTGIVSPDERGKGTAMLVAGVPGKEELDDTEIPTLNFTGFIHLEALINKCSPSSEYSNPGTPRNLWLESPENAESPGSDDLEVARSMYPLRERSIFRRSWAELLEAPLNSEGLHILQTNSTEEARENGQLHLPAAEKSQAITPPRGRHPRALEGPFPLLPQQPKLRRQRSQSLPRYYDASSRNRNATELTLNPQETRFFFPSDHNLLKRENAKQKKSIEEAWQKGILSGSSEHPPVNPSFENSSAKCNKIGISGDRVGLRSGSTGISSNTFGVPMVNVGIPKGNIGVSVNNVGIPTDFPGVPRGNGGVPLGNSQVFRGNDGVTRRSGTEFPGYNVETFRNRVGTSRRIVSSPLTELLKIGEHQL